MAKDAQLKREEMAIDAQLAVEKMMLDAQLKAATIPPAQPQQAEGAQPERSEPQVVVVPLPGTQKQISIIRDANGMIAGAEVVEA